jgi:hypothetical protein
VGPGRLLEPDDILKMIYDKIDKLKSLKSKTFENQTQKMDINL